LIEQPFNPTVYLHFQNAAKDVSNIVAVILLPLLIAQMQLIPSATATQNATIIINIVATVKSRTIGTLLL